MPPQLARGIRSSLLGQKRVSGIGNIYGQDLLCRARRNPLRPINLLGYAEIESGCHAIRNTLEESIAHGGSQWEQNLYGEQGRWDSCFFLIAYREGKPCPNCGTTVDKIKTGSTSTHICPSCHPQE